MFQRQLDHGYARKTPLRDDGFRPLLVYGRKRRVEFPHAANADRLDGNAEPAPTIFELLNERS